MDHRNYYHDGIRIPSCTEIIAMLNKPELVNWANYMGFKRINTTHYVEEKARYGTEQHKLFELYFNDAILKIEPEIKETIYKFRMIELYFERIGIRVLNTELPIEGTTYGGTLDMIAYNRSRDCIVIYDLKTSKAVRQSHWIQLMGYVELVEEVYNLPVGEIGVILLSEPLNSPNLINTRYTKDCLQEQAVFDALKAVWYKMNDLSRSKIVIKTLTDDIMEVNKQ